MSGPKVDEKIILREEGSEAFLFNPDTGIIKTLNDTGIFIWKLCDGKHSEECIIGKITKHYEGISKEEAKNDVLEFLKKLEGAGWLRRDTANAGRRN